MFPPTPYKLMRLTRGAAGSFIQEIDRMLQVVNKKPATIKRPPTLRFNAERKWDVYLRTSTRVRHVQAVAHGRSIELREHQGQFVDVDEFNECVKDACRAMEQAIDCYSEFSEIHRIQHIEEYKSLEMKFISSARFAAGACRTGWLLPIRTRNQQMVVHERIASIRNVLGDTCAAAELVLHWLETRGVKTVVRIEDFLQCA
jgi:hypothetical protein